MRSGFAAGEVRAPLKRGGERLEGRVAVAQIAEVGQRERLARRIRARLIDRDQPGRIGERQRAQQRRVDEREHRGVGADGDRQDRGDRRGETGRGREAPSRITDVFDDSHGQGYARRVRHPTKRWPAIDECALMRVARARARTGRRASATRSMKSDRYGGSACAASVAAAHWRRMPRRVIDSADHRAARNRALRRPARQDPDARAGAGQLDHRLGQHDERDPGRHQAVRARGSA